MMGLLPPKFATQRVLILCIPALLILTFLFLAAQGGSVSALLPAIKNSAASIGQNSSPPPPRTDGFGDLLSELYKPIKLPVTAGRYVDQRGNILDNGGRNHWKTPLGKDILIVDIDTRLPQGTNDVFSDTKMDWAAVKASGTGLLTVSHVNHFLYSQIHGYDYKFFHAREMKDHYNTWIKPHALHELLRDHKFVVFIDADAIIQHLEVPMEFLFNRWDVSPNTSIALPVDTRQIVDDGVNISTDSKGKVVLNTGVVVLQNLPHTHDMMVAWKECTSERRYPGCGQWRDQWSHEQRAFSEYIRYDFNPQGNNIVEIPCNDANGFPGLLGRFGIADDCKGEFIRHYTVEKPTAKTSTSDAVMQTIGELLQKNFAANQASMLIEEA